MDGQGRRRLQRAGIVAGVAWALVVAVCAHGYVHPDEFFQSVEVGARDVLEKRGGAATAWEWGGEVAMGDESWRRFVPCRSISFAALAAHLPLAIGRRVTESRRLALVGPRLWTWLASACHDLALRRVWFRCGVDVDAAHLAYRTSWTTWVFHARPLSNVYETFALSLAFLCCVEARPALLGAVTALGCFWRFSFAFLAAPLAARLESLRSRASCAAAFAAVAACLVATDSWYFGRLVVTPWANFRFNSSAHRLASFGVNPRWTHVLVNLPLLYGSCAWSWRRGTRNLTTLQASALTALLALSTAPHQEPRFLLPAAVAVFATPARTSAAWLLYNALVGAFFAFVHQAGTTQLLLADHADDSCLLLVGSYLAPRSLLPPNAAAADLLLDRATFAAPAIASFLDDPAHCFHSTTTRRVALAGTVPLDPLRDALAARRATLSRNPATFWPHFSAEFPPTALHHFQLHLYDLLPLPDPERPPETNASTPHLLS